MNFIIWTCFSRWGTITFQSSNIIVMMENMTCGSDWFILIWQTQCSVCFDVGTFNMLTPPPILLLSEAQMIKRNVYFPYTSSDITLDDITDISSRQGLPKMNSSLNWDLRMEVDVLDANIIIEPSKWVKPPLKLCGEQSISEGWQRPDRGGGIKVGWGEGSV